MPKLFITGTDTEVGKTSISINLITALNAHHYSTVGIKPLATGCISKNGILYSHDALSLQERASVKLDYPYINPFAFAKPIAPHIAAQENQTTLTTAHLNSKLKYALNYPADWHIIEGVGGWMVPLHHKETMADFVKFNQFPVLLVVGMRLGCLNHALLTYYAIQQNSISCIGWIANCIEPRNEIDELIFTLKNLLPVPCLGIIPYGEHTTMALNIDEIIKIFS